MKWCTFHVFSYKWIVISYQETVLIHWACSKIAAASDVPDGVLLDMLVEKVSTYYTFTIFVLEHKVMASFLNSISGNQPLAADAIWSFKSVWFTVYNLKYLTAESMPDDLLRGSCSKCTPERPTEISCSASRLWTEIFGAGELWSGYSDT